MARNFGGDLYSSGSARRGPRQQLEIGMVRDEEEACIALQQVKRRAYRERRERKERARAKVTLPKLKFME